jgi:putative tryptophan/tyrosine transport system substrate-binding protein
MDRRAFITSLGAVLAAALAVEAQAGNIPRIGVLVPVEPDDPKEPNVGAFRQALRDLGYVDGQNIAVEYRYARGKAELYPALANELVRLGVDVMVVGSWHPTLEAKKATQTIPIVGVGMGLDPVALGIVSSLARPGGNVTGSSFLTGTEFGGKYVELLKEVAPGTVRVAYLRDPRGRTAQLSSSEAAQAAARSFRVAYSPRWAVREAARLSSKARCSSWLMQVTSRSWQRSTSCPQSMQ